MKRKIFIFLISALFLIFCYPVNSIELSTISIDKYINKISNKFSNTYCNTTKFGISKEGAISFALGETNKEFKNKKLNRLIDYSLLKQNILNNLQNNCNEFNFPPEKLDELKLD